MNIVDNILYQCRFQAPALALAAPGTALSRVSYRRLEMLIHNVSRRAAAFGLARGHVVALFIKEPVLHAAILLGLTRLGVATVSGRNPELPAVLKIAALITDLNFPYQAPMVLRADFGWTEGDGTPVPDERIGETRADDPCRIVLTSGTTGDAKAVALSHRMVAERIARHQVVFGDILPQCARTYCDLGLATSLGFQFLVYVLGRGGAMV